MTRIIHGVVRGKTIALEEDLGLAEGETVEVTVRTVVPPTDRQPEKGFSVPKVPWRTILTGTAS